MRYALLLKILFFGLQLQAKPPTDPSRPLPSVLVLVSRSPADEWAVAQVDGMLRVLQDAKSPAPSVVEYMDARGGGMQPDQEARLADYYESKFGGRSIRAVIAADDPALNFVLKYRDRLFPHAAAVACGIERFPEDKQRSWLTAVTEQNDAPGTFRLALSLQPKLKRLLIVDDDRGSGALEKARIEAACADEIRSVRIDLVKGDRSQALFRAVESLPADSAVLLGRSRMPRRVIDELNARCPVPIYALRAPVHFPGSVGGSLLDGERHGAAAARMALRLLAGERANAIPVETNLPARLVVDHREMQRHNLPFAALPMGIEILHQPPTFWQQHGSLLQIAAVVIVLLGGASAMLLVQVRKNRATAEQLSRSLSTLNATFDSTTDGMLVVDKDGRISACNERFLELWKIPRHIGAPGQDETFLRHAVIQLKDASSFLTRIRELYANTEATSQGELIEFKDGRVFERASQPLRKGNQTTGRVWSFRDVTARLNAEREKRRLGDQLAQAQKMEALGSLAGGIAHDFNNILTGIIGYAELAKARLPGRHPAAEDLDHVLRASDRAKELIRQILTFSRKHTPEKRPLALEPVIRETLKLLRATVPAGIELRAELSPEAGTVLADPTQIHQAVLNLATNAMHAMAQGPGEIVVALQSTDVSAEFAVRHPPLRPGCHVCLSVRDTGHGMDDATIKRIFEPFFTTKGPGEGTGLGLAVVQAIVEGHEGVLTVESEPECGSCFRIYLPVARESQILRVKEIQLTPTGAGEHILVVDDEAMIIEVYRNYLEGLGYRASAAQSPEQALAKFTRNPAEYAAVITDLNMPQMNGIELVRRLRCLRADLPVLLCTGFVGSAATEQEAASVGISEILGKPFTSHTLGLAIQRTLRPPRPLAAAG